MEQLLEFRTIPMAFELEVKNAKLEMKTERPGYDMTRIDGSLSISHQYPRMHADTYEARSSMGLKSMMQASRESAEDSLRAALEATAHIAERGNLLAKVQDGVTIPGVIRSEVFQRIQDSQKSTIGFIPSVSANIHWDAPQLSMQYEADRLRFDWRTDGPQMEFTPADVIFHVKEYPRLEIEYVGKPLYVPPSASPDYEPPAMDVVA